MLHLILIIFLTNTHYLRNNLKYFPITFFLVCYDFLIIRSTHLQETNVAALKDFLSAKTNFCSLHIFVSCSYSQVKVGTNYAKCSCKKFVMCEILCRHGFCALNHFEVVKLPRYLVLNRWSKNAENAPSLSNL